MHDSKFEEFDLDGVNAYKESGFEKGLKRDWTGVRDVAGKLAIAAPGSYKVEIERKIDSLDSMVNHPSHYNQGGIETLDIIKMSLTPEEYRGYLKGNVLKYRERAQFKGNAEQDYAKARFYYDELEVAE